jgi:Zn-dependent peptidase ImmA (M78 family)
MCESARGKLRSWFGTEFHFLRNPKWISQVAKSKYAKYSRRIKSSAPSVPVEQIAESYGIELRYEPAEQELSGALIRKGRKEVVIGVNSSHHPNRQRFTIAHEIAHFLLHEGI